LIAVVATLATFMEVLDTSIANVALPHIAGNLGASVNDSTWVLTSYLVANAIVLPASAWLASVLGRRNYYLVSVSIFAASSFLCGIAPSLGMLVAFRLLQGLGGGGLQPLTQSILVDTFPPRMRGMGMAVYGMTVVVAPVIGPTLGGWITDNYNWRWIFFINVPIGALALFLSSRYISDPPYFLRRTGERRWSGDFFGLSLLAMGLGSLQMMLDLGDRYDWFHSPFIVGCAVLAGLALLAGVLWSLNHREPIVNLRVLRDRNLSLSCVHMLIFGAVLFASTALLPLMMQTLLGYTAQQSGMALSPGGIVIAIMMPIIGFMVSRVDARWMIVFGILIVAYALWMMSGLTLQTDFRTIVIARVVQGFGLAFIFVPINTVAYANVAGVDRNNASSLISIARNIGGSIGIGYTAAMLSQGTQIHRAMMVRDLTPASPVYNSTVGALQDHLETAIGDPTRAADMAQGIVGSTLDMQARMLTYLDQFKLLAVAFLLLVPIVILMRRRKQGGHVELVVE
jgi:DHA2 family multidrug resistance protein